MSPDRFAAKQAYHKVPEAFGTLPTKELCSQAVHIESRERDGLGPVRDGALPENLLAGRSSKARAAVNAETQEQERISLVGPAFLHVAVLFDGLLGISTIALNGKCGMPVDPHDMTQPTGRLPAGEGFSRFRSLSNV